MGWRASVTHDSQEPLLEGRDYYFDERGLMVLTSAFLARRGFCCRNGCRHCPYGYGPEGAAKAFRTADH